MRLKLVSMALAVSAAMFFAHLSTIEHRNRRCKRPDQPKTLAHLLKYDSILAILNLTFKLTATLLSLTARSKALRRRPGSVDWESLGVQLLWNQLPFTDATDAKKHLAAP